jgi:cupin 2 domain-containing protein
VSDRPANLLTDLPTDLPAELTQLLLQSPGVRIERIVSRGHRSPENFWYDQPAAEWVAVLAGRARVRFEDGEVVEMTPGSYLNIAAHRRHRVDWTDPDQDTVWLAVHYQ